MTFFQYINISALLGTKKVSGIIDFENNVIAKKDDNEKIIENFKVLKGGFFVFSFDNLLVIIFN